MNKIGILIQCGILKYEVFVLIPINTMDELQAYINTYLDYSGDNWPQKERIYKYFDSGNNYK